MVRGKGSSWTSMLVVVGIGLALMYLFSIFTTGMGDTLEFVRPEGTGWIVMVAQILLLIGIVMGSLKIAAMLNRPLTKRDAFTLVLVGIAIWFLWQNVIVPVFGATDLTDITFTMVKKVGLVR